MNPIFNLLRNPIAERFGWSLVHLLWQGAAVGILLAIVLWLLRHRSANARYLAAVTALFSLPALLGISCVTFVPPNQCTATTIAPETAAAGTNLSGDSTPSNHSQPTHSPATGSLSDAPVVSSDAVIGAPSPRDVPLETNRNHSHEVRDANDTSEVDATQSASFTLPQSLLRRWAALIESALHWIVGIWVIGLTVLSVRHLGGWYAMQRLRVHGTAPVAPALQATLNRLRAQFRIRRPVTLMQTSRLAVPSLIGFLKPVILLPGCVMTGLTLRQLETVLAHELAHVRRHDYVTNLLQTVVDTLLFFHPVVWWISQRVRIERENCCDDLAVSMTGDRLLYAQSLTQLEVLRHQNSMGNVSELTLAAAGGSLIDRIRRILGDSPQRTARSRFRMAGTTGLSGLLTGVAVLLVLLPGLLTYPGGGTAEVMAAPSDDDVPSTRLGDLTVLHEVAIGEFKSGATVSLGTGSHRFETIPDFLANRRYTKRHGYQGILRFRVEKAQRVYFAVYGADWGGGGNPSGGWRKELVSRAELEKQGWKEAGRITGEHTLLDGNKLPWIVFTRQCKTGEVFAIRTHKYQAPILFSAKTAPKGAGGDSAAPAKRRAMPPIDLGNTNCRIELNPENNLPGGLYAVGSYRIAGQSPDAKVLYDWRRTQRVSDGNLELVGRVSGHIPNGATFRILRFVRSGTELNATVEYRLPVAITNLSMRSVYFRARLPQTRGQSLLPAGNYRVRIDFKPRKGGAAVKMAPLSCRFAVANRGISAELRKLAKAAVALKPSVQFGRFKSDQRSTGLDLSRILKLSGQDRDRKTFTTDHRYYAAGVNALVQGRKIWALCSLLDHSNVDARILAARGLEKLADPNSVAVLFAAAKRNSHVVSGSENATLHSIYRSALKRGLEKTTGLRLTPRGLSVTTTNAKKQRVVIRSSDAPGHAFFSEEVDFSKVDNWVQTVFLGRDSRPAQKTYILKQVKTPADRGTLHDAYQRVRRPPTTRDELRYVKPISRKPARQSLKQWFDDRGAWIHSARDEAWVLFRSKHFSDNDRMWIQKITRKGNHFTVVMHRGIWLGPYYRNVGFHEYHGVNFGKLAPGDYKVAWLVMDQGFTKIDARGFPADGKPFEIVTARLSTSFTVVASRKPLPGASVRKVQRRGQVVWLNLGTADGLKIGRQFRIVERVANGKREPRMKGLIEVVRVTGPKLAEARILQSQIDRPIAVGDLLVPIDVGNELWVIKTLKANDDRGALHDLSRRVRTGKPTKVDELVHASALNAEHQKDLDKTFEKLKSTGVQLTSNDNSWVLFRSKQVDDNDRMFVTRVERKGNTFVIHMLRCTWKGDYSKNVTYHEVLGINLGKLGSGKYTAKWRVGRTQFEKFDKQGWPAVLEIQPGDAAELSIDFEAATRKVTTIAGITEYRLDNGLRVLLFSDGSQPTVTVNMTVLVGSRHEGSGEGGMAHLLEHMLFKGTPTHPKIPAVLRARGAKFNATTNVDRTRYFETLPAGDKNLEFAIRLEADRLVNSLIRKQDLDSEMTVVRNEFEIARTSSAKSLRSAMTAAAYEWHNYGKTTIGNQSDIERVPIEKLRRFYKTYYRPDNVVLIIGGKFDEARGLALVEKHFGRLPKPATPIPKTYTEEPTQQGERVVSVQKRSGSSSIGMLFHVPAAAHPDFAPLAVLRDLLTHNPSGPLYRALVQKGLSSSVSAVLTQSHDPGYLLIVANARNAALTNRIRDEMFKVFIALATGKKPAAPKANGKPVGNGKTAAPDTLAAAVELSRLRFRIALAQLMSDPAKLVNQLSEWSAAGDWRLCFVHANRVEKVKPADVRRVVAKYLKRDNRTIGYYLKVRKTNRVEIPTTPDIAGTVRNLRYESTVSRGESFEPTWKNLRARARFTALPEGLRIAMLPQRTNGKSITLILVLRYGNPASLKGKWCDFIPEYMTLGTRKYNTEQLKLAFTRIRSGVAVAGGNGTMRFHLRTDREHFPQAVELLRQVLREPALPPGELNKLKLKYFRKRLSRRPSLARIGQLFAGNVAADDPRHFPAGRAAVPLIRNMTHPVVKKIVEESIGAHAGEMVIVGDFDVDDAMKRIQSVFRGWKGKVPYQRLVPGKPEMPTSLSHSIPLPGLPNAYYDAAMSVAIRQTHPDYPAVMLAGAIAGARLRNRIREKEGFSYRVSSRLTASPQDDIGRFTIAATCNPANMPKLIVSVREELERIRRDGFTDLECRRAVASYLKQLETARSQSRTIVGMLGMCLVMGKHLGFYEQQEQAFRRLKADEINTAFRRYLDPSRLTVVTLGDLPKSASGTSLPAKLSPVRRQPIKAARPLGSRAVLQAFAVGRSPHSMPAKRGSGDSSRLAGNPEFYADGFTFHLQMTENSFMAMFAQNESDLTLQAQQLWNQTIEFLTQKGIDLGVNLLAAVAIFFIGRWVAGILTRVVSRVMNRARIDETLIKFLGNIAYTILLTFVVLASISRLGIDTTSFAAVMAAAGLAVGLALQGSLSNFASGVMLILFKPFRVGDFVNAGGSSGVIEEIHIFSTLMRTGDNVKIIVPNSQITGGTITNYSAKETRRIDLVVGCGYDDDLKAVKEFLLKLIDADERILSDPKPVVAVNELGDSSVNFVVRPWVMNSEYWDVRWDLTEKIKTGFDECGFSIPYPSRDVHLHQATA
eukprot:g12573.t1